MEDAQQGRNGSDCPMSATWVENAAPERVISEIDAMIDGIASNAAVRSETDRFWEIANRRRGATTPERAGLSPERPILRSGSPK